MTADAGKRRGEGSLPAEGPIALLTVTTLYPNTIQKAHGLFVETRLRKLVESGKVKAHVLAPVPWLPFLSHPTMGPIHRVPRHERRHGIDIEHPRYLVIPKIGMNVTPLMLYRTLRAALKRILARGDRVDLIDAHYFYPDGVAAVWLAEEFNLPVTVTGRGTDLNLIPAYPVPRKRIQQAAARADGLITVCQALKDSLVELGVPADRVTVLRNGVDLDLFRPQDRGEVRGALGLKRRTLGSVGHLVARKGNHLLIRALVDLPDTDLIIAGDGPERGALEALAVQSGVAERVRFLGAVEHHHLPRIYGAIDALVLASSREGWANVLLEAMACGTPVIASAIWGTPEVVAAPAAGVLMASLDAKGIVDAVHMLFAALPSREATRAYAEKFNWDATTEGQLALFREILARRDRREAAPG